MNKPVAWKSTLQSKWFIPNEDMETGKYDKQFWIPLYTHPVKELTDEEMLEICQRIGVDYGSWYIHEFARAILRKAQEK